MKLKRRNNMTKGPRPLAHFTIGNRTSSITPIARISVRVIISGRIKTTIMTRKSLSPITSIANSIAMWTSVLNLLRVRIKDWRGPNPLWSMKIPDLRKPTSSVWPNNNKKRASKTIFWVPLPASRQGNCLLNLKRLRKFKLLRSKTVGDHSADDRVCK